MGVGDYDESDHADCRPVTATAAPAEDTRSCFWITIPAGRSCPTMFQHSGGPWSGSAGRPFRPKPLSVHLSPSPSRTWSQALPPPSPRRPSTDATSVLISSVIFCHTGVIAAAAACAVPHRCTDLTDLCSRLILLLSAGSVIFAYFWTFLQFTVALQCLTSHLSVQESFDYFL